LGQPIFLRTRKPPGRLQEFGDSSRRFLASLVRSTNGDLARAKWVNESRALTPIEEAPRRISALQAKAPAPRNRAAICATSGYRIWHGYFLTMPKVATARAEINAVLRKITP
jgi:hypothetical protein